MTPDPLGGDITNPQSLNRYAYVLNNPTTNIDPSGLTNIPGYDLGGRWGGGSCFLYLACGLPTGGGFGSNWNEFGLMNIPVVGQTFAPPQLLSTIDWAAMGNANGFATSVSFFEPGGWTTAQIGTGFDLIGMFENPYQFGPGPSWAHAFVKSFFSAKSLPTAWNSLTRSNGCSNLLFKTFANDLNPIPTGPSLAAAIKPAADFMSAALFSKALGYAASQRVATVSALLTVGFWAMLLVRCPMFTGCARRTESSS